MPPELGSNLVAIDRVGKLLWQAPLPTKEADDHYVPSLRMVDQGVSATSWSAYWVILNPRNGKIRHKEFAK